MPVGEAGSRSSLFNMSEVRIEDGSPLPLVGYMCGVEELQGFLAVPHLHEHLLLAVLRYYIDVAVE